jgi:sugar phosphate isomerase/epimerase
MFPIALSTMWLRDRHESLAEFFDAGRDVGFDLFELNHFVTLDLVRQSPLPEGEIHAVHVPCPTQPHSADAQVSALDKEERQLAVDAAKASIDLAHQIGAKGIILHPGAVDIDPGLEKELRRLYNEGQQNTSRYADVKDELMALRARHMERHLDATMWSVERLASYADAAGVRLGMENRYHFHEIPLPDEMDRLIQEFAGPAGFWFDVGHAYVLEALGLVGHKDWLGFSGNLVGMHLHDVQVVPQDGAEPPQRGTAAKLLDHMIPGTGVIDFSELLPPPDASVLLTCEFSWVHPPDQIEAGREHLLRYLQVT